MYRGEENGRAATLRLLPHPQGSRSFVVRDQPRHRNLSVFRKLLLSCRLLLCCLYSSNVSGGRYSSALSVSLRRPPPAPHDNGFQSTLVGAVSVLWACVPKREAGPAPDGQLGGVVGGRPRPQRENVLVRPQGQHNAADFVPVLELIANHREALGRATPCPTPADGR